MLPQLALGPTAGVGPFSVSRDHPGVFRFQVYAPDAPVIKIADLECAMGPIAMQRYPRSEEARRAN